MKQASVSSTDQGPTAKNSAFRGREALPAFNNGWYWNVLEAWGRIRGPPEMSFRFSNNPAYWRDRAAEACTMASTADAEAKAILLRLANDFVRLADRAEARLKQEKLSTIPKDAPNSVAG
jgi:hypothetical protein